MTRYMVLADDCWVTAVYGPGDGIGFTTKKEDASTWVTYERAVEAAKLVAARTNGPVAVHSVEEPNYPKSWK